MLQGLRTICDVVATGACYGSQRWLLRLLSRGMIQRVLRLLQALTEAHQEDVVATMVSVRRKESFDGYRGQPRTNMVLWWIQGLPIDHKDGFCGQSYRHRSRVL